MLTKQRVIMDADFANAEYIQFTEQLDEPGFARTVRLARRDWDDMGEPETITLTIDPGDLLNDDEVSA